MQLGAVGWSSLKKQIVSPPSLPSQNVDGCSPLSNEGEEARGEKKHEKFQSFYCALRFNFLLLCKRYSPPYFFNNAGTCTLNQGSSVHFSRNRKWKVFHSERGFLYFFVVQFKCFTQAKCFTNWKSLVLQHCELRFMTFNDLSGL